MFNGCDKKPPSSGPFTEKKLRELSDKKNTLTEERKLCLLKEINRYKDTAPPEKKYLYEERSPEAVDGVDDLFYILLEIVQSRDKELLSVLEDSKISLNDNRAKLVFYGILKYGDMDSVNYLIKKGILKEKRTADLALFYAACAGKNRTELIHLVAREGKADVNACREGDPLLHWVAFKGYEDSIQTLIRLGADVNKRDDIFMETPLHVAAKYGNWEVAQVLLENGADYTIKDKVGRTPLDKAMELPDIDHESVRGKGKVAGLIRQYMKKSKDVERIEGAR